MKLCSCWGVFTTLLTNLISGELVERVVESEERHSMRRLSDCCRFLDVVRKSANGLKSFELFDS